MNGSEWILRLTLREEQTYNVTVLMPCRVGSLAGQTEEWLESSAEAAQ